MEFADVWYGFCFEFSQILVFALFSDLQKLTGSGMLIGKLGSGSWNPISNL